MKRCFKIVWPSLELTCTLLLTLFHHKLLRSFLYILRIIIPFCLQCRLFLFHIFIFLIFNLFYIIFLRLILIYSFTPEKLSLHLISFDFYYVSFLQRISVSSILKCIHFCLVFLSIFLLSFVNGLFLLYLYFVLFEFLSIYRNIARI